ncbi:MAG TPA: hypothetical protein VFP74_10885 [Pseudolabrys sp.]|jgi:hypothetical protein|nr:hypothetical protein [Pseudolabrys sp.]HEX2539150.1 hypothetical protein [Pseudolabrys sp.]
MTNPSPANAIGTAAEAERVIDSLNTVMDRLIETVEAETAHMRKGRLRDALALETQKRELAARYAAESGRVRVSQAMIAKSLPQALAKLRERHAAFESLLQTNLTVIATAHAVSEGIIRGVSGELARKQTPSTYGAGGRANAPSPRAGQPLAISRTL